MHTTEEVTFYLKWNWKTQAYLNLESDMLCFFYFILKGEFENCVENRVQNKMKQQQKYQFKGHSRSPPK